jgi:anti-sigma B factor antagonist
VGEPADFAVEVEPGDESVVVHVTGELDMASAETFEAAVSSAPASSHVVIDLDACSFLDSAGVRVITAAMRGADRLSIVATDAGVLRVLEITGIDTLVSVFPSIEAAR